MEEKTRGNLVKETRLLLGMTQKDLGLRIHRTQTTVSGWEKDVSRPSDSDLQEIVNLLTSASFELVDDINKRYELLNSLHKEISKSNPKFIDKEEKEDSKSKIDDSAFPRNLYSYITSLSSERQKKVMNYIFVMLLEEKTQRELWLSDYFKTKEEDRSEDMELTCGAHMMYLNMFTKAKDRIQLFLDDLEEHAEENHEREAKLYKMQ